MFPVLNSLESKNLDEYFEQEGGIASGILMERAGYSTFRLIEKLIQGQKDKNIAVLCGSGNNGGDGLVAARYLLQNGYSAVSTFLVKPSGQSSILNQENYDKLKSIGHEVNIINHDCSTEYKNIIENADIIIDALLGVGIKGKVKEPYSTIISLINQAKGLVISVDLPSGIDGDTGEILGEAVEADYTLTMLALKRGLFFYPGRKKAGNIYLEKLDTVIPQGLFNTYLLDEKILINYLPKRYETAHKGEFGRMLMISGSHAYQGAPIFLALGFFKVGGGYIYSLIPQIPSYNLINWVPEVVLTDKSVLPNILTLNDYDTVEKFSQLANVIALGPGLGVKEETQQLVRKVVENLHQPMVIDGDGLMALTDNLNILKDIDREIVLTPHKGEFAKLLKKDHHILNDIDIIEAVRKFSQEFKIFLVLKGSPTLVGNPSGEVYLLPVGTVGLATPGSGDVLTGMISGFIGQGVETEKSILLAVYLHGLAGEKLSKQYEPRGYLARDIPHKIPNLLNDLRAGKLNIITERFLKEV